jgi:DNA repair protein RecN (Recombination protein N)
MQLSKLRKQSAVKLSEIVEKELAYLKMDSVKFEVKITELAKENYNRDGIDAVRFMAATNKNSLLDDISKIASGGELSRFMLALKVALSDVKSVPILIFDEIDTGIGGAVANAVGERLKLLAQKLQVMVVTHHAQVAAKANHHLRVRKTAINQITNTFVDMLNQTQREQEIARMLSGETISEEALAAARKLIIG